VGTDVFGASYGLRMLASDVKVVWGAVGFQEDEEGRIWETEQTFMLTVPLGPAWLFLRIRVLKLREGALCKEHYTKRLRHEAPLSQNPDL